ncbi:YobA family protein [Neobacillus niacini]|uniref:YobA family protein n=1 Tax=Neobacillus niacini TaxID=86668 RepID=UPI0021CB00A0|nr:YobA family protein [Neobacillus niacini]MCM3768500.1 YobA family protein [Neobacillus niacini]
MRLKNRFLLLTFIIGLLVACTPVNTDPNDNEIKVDKATGFFIGTIEEKSDQNAIVNVDQGEILKSGNRVFVNLSVNSNATFQVGDKIRVDYEGEVRESYPFRINVTNVELIN